MQDSNIQVVLYIANKLKEKGIEFGETKLYKLLWFTSLQMADKEGDLLLHDIFVKNKFGPIPENLYDYISSIKNSKSGKNEYLQVKQERKEGYNFYIQNTITPLQHCNEEFISPIAKKILDEIIEKYGNINATKLSNKSHDTARDDAKMKNIVDITKDMKNDKYKDIVKESYENIVYMMAKMKYAM